MSINMNHITIITTFLQYFQLRSSNHRYPVHPSFPSKLTDQIISKIKLYVARTRVRSGHMYLIYMYIREVLDVTPWIRVHTTPSWVVVLFVLSGRRSDSAQRVETVATYRVTLARQGLGQRGRRRQHQTHEAAVQ